MLDRLRDLFASKNPPTLTDLIESRKGLEIDHEAASLNLTRITREANAALVDAIERDDEKGRLKERKRITDAEVSLHEIEAAIDGLDQRIETAKQIEAGNRLAMDSAERAQMALDREQAAELMQRHLADFCAAYWSFYDVGQRIEGRLGTRAVRSALQDSNLLLSAEIQQTIVCGVPANTIGDRAALAHFTVHEFQRDGLLKPLVETVRAQNARLLTTA